MELNFKRKNTPTKNDYFPHEPKRILLFVDSEEIDYRVKALDVLGQYLQNIYENGVTNDLDQSLKISITFAVLTRCDDVSPNVRAKALKVFYQVAELILKVLDETKDKGCLKIEPGVDISELELDVNGEHRFFWYCMTSFEERQTELMAVIRRRMDDANVYVRKQAIAVLEKLIVTDNNFITKKNLKSLKSAFNDSKIPVKIQSMASLTNIFTVCCHNSEIQELWLRCILPLVEDPEDVVQSTALSLLEKQFLPGERLSIPLLKRLLKRLTSGYFLVYHKFLKKAFAIWKLKNKLNSEHIGNLIKNVETEYEECTWFYISLFAEYCTISLEIFPKLCEQNLSNCLSMRQPPASIEYTVKTLMHLFDKLPSNTVETILRIARSGLESFYVPLACIPMYTELIKKIYKQKGMASDIENFSSSMVQECENYLLEVQSKVLFNQPIPIDDVLARYFSTLTECFLLFPSQVTCSTIGLLRCFAGCVEFPMTFSSTVKAHALVALGKICLLDDDLAKELLQVFAEELLTSKQEVIRSNVCVILVDMCKRHPYVTDVCIPLICTCFKDNMFLIRYQAIVQVIDLFLKGYIKWKYPLIFGFLSALIDRREVIRELGHYAFDNLLTDVKRQMFLDYFIDSIFVLNCFPPPDNESIAQSVKQLKMFSASGDAKRGERMILYRFLLEQMNVKEKVKAIDFVCGILTKVAGSVYPLNIWTQCVVRDCFSILTCDEIKAVTVDSSKDVDEPVEDQQSIMETEIKRIFIVDPIVKVTIGLTRSIKNPNSDLAHDIILFLKELLSDYADDIQDILAQDPILLTQLQLEIRKDEVRKRVMIERKKDLLTA